MDSNCLSYCPLREYSWGGKSLYPSFHLSGASCNRHSTRPRARWKRWVTWSGKSWVGWMLCRCGSVHIGLTARGLVLLPRNNKAELFCDMFCLKSISFCSLVGYCFITQHQRGLCRDKDWCKNKNYDYHIFPSWIHTRWRMFFILLKLWLNDSFFYLI